VKEEKVDHHFIIVQKMAPGLHPEAMLAVQVCRFL